VNKRPWKTIAVLLAVVLVPLAVIASPLVYSGVYTGVTIEGVEVGGRSKDEIKQMLSLWRYEYRARQLLVYYGDLSFKIVPDAIDYDLDVDATAEEAWSFGRRGSWWERLRNIYSAKRDGYFVPIHDKYNDGKFGRLIDEWREAIDRPPRNAAVSLLTGGIIPHEQGRKLEIETLRPLVLKALHKGDVTLVPLPVVPLYPEVTVAEISQTGLKEIWASFTTSFDPSDANRTANIRLSARRINGHIVYPGQTFSFNEVVGPRDKEHGFKEALEIVDGEFVPGIGGGVCQVSSTLYNAVILANLDVAERSNHSKPLGYVGLGRDATVAYGALDFKFTNNSGSPVMIMAETESSKLVVGIVGQRPMTESVQVLSEDKQLISPAIVKKQDPELYLGETKVDKQGKPGFEITTVRVVRIDGREIRREILARDHYLPENTIVKVGSKLPPFAQGKVHGTNN
jgi:vancomycin resistance protein YoaR